MMEPRHEPHGVEGRWQRDLGGGGPLPRRAPAPAATRSYVICVPPPNVTGELHMGHALNGSIQDALVRWHRMRGFDTLWQPGYDHAGIATQNVVEKQLIAEGTSRQEIGREAFLERTWDWLDEDRPHDHGPVPPARLLARLRARALHDGRGLRRGGHDLLRASLGARLDLRANRIVNWCPHHQTAISDLEVEHVETDDALTYVRYPFVDGSGSITIATVRPGDDPRRHRGRRASRTTSATADAIGKEVVVPVVGRRRAGDRRRARRAGVRHRRAEDHARPRPDGLRDRPRPRTSARRSIGDRRRRPHGSARAGFEGLTRRRPSRRSSPGCSEHGQLEKRENYRHSVGTCERCHTRIEPLVSPQWWCAMDELAAPAIDALQERRVRFHPESQHRFAIDSLENAPDWCLSRQLWWGHQIPIWTCADGHVTVAWPPPDRCAECGVGASCERSQDVLDTWFSSALWPFATLGWPAETPELERYYPGDVNVTAREIIRLWENRMIFTGLFLCGDVPFTDVIITATVLAVDGRRMSKSLGTGIDPLEAVDRARRRRDPLRAAEDVVDPGRPLQLGRDRGGSRLANKLWNVVAPDAAAPARTRARSGDRRRSRSAGSSRRIDDDARRARGACCRRSSSRASSSCSTTSSSTTSATGTPRRSSRASTRATRRRSRRRSPRSSGCSSLLHPVMPHVTEEIWSQFHDTRLIVVAVARGRPAGARRPATRSTGCRRPRSIFRRSGVLPPLDGEEKRIFDAVVKPERVKVTGDVEAECSRVRKEIARSEGMLANERFVAGAPAEVVEAERDKLERYRRELTALGSTRPAGRPRRWPTRDRASTGSPRSRRGRRSSGSGGCARCSPISASRSARSPRSTSSARTARRRRRS